MFSKIEEKVICRAIETAPDAIFFENPDGELLLWNRGAELLYGYQADQVVGRVLVGLNTASIREELTQAEETGQLVLVSQECSDGSRAQVWLRSGIVRDENGELLAFHHCGRLRQDALNFLESAPNAVLTVNEQGGIMQMNSAAEALFGYSHAEIQSLTVEDLIPERYRDKHVHFRRHFHQQPLARPMGIGRDLFGRHRDGHEFPVEVALQPLNQGIVMVTVVDLTQRVTAEQRFKLAVEAAPCGMLMTDSEGRIAMVNSHAEGLFGYPRAELLGASIENLVPPRYRERHAAFREEFGEAPTARSMGAGRELFGLRKDGTEVPVEIGLNPITTEEGSFVLASVVDSTERRKRTEELRKSLRDKELLLQEIHHRVKNNLAVIGSILFLQSSTTEDRELLRVLKECQDRVRSMSLVHERLYLTGDLGQLNFADYVRELTEQLAHNNIMSGQRISLVFQLESLPLDLKQAVPCGLILNELLSNAFKHAFTGLAVGQVSVFLHRLDDGEITLAVQDDGRGDESTSFEREGSLGFRLIRSLTRQLDGDFEIQCAPGGGTRAQLSFMETEGAT